MKIQRMEHVGIVVDDLAAATAFFVELGLKLQDEGHSFAAGRHVVPLRYREVCVSQQALQFLDSQAAVRRDPAQRPLATSRP